MKKLAVFIAFILLCVGFMLTEDLSLYNISGLSKVCFVTYDQVDGVETIETSQYNYIYCTPNEAKSLSNKINKVGVINYFEKTEKAKILKNIKANISMMEKIDNMEVIYGYSPLYKCSLCIENKKVNFQMAVKEDEILLGFPLILGGF